MVEGFQVFMPLRGRQYTAVALSVSARNCSRSSSASANAPYCGAMLTLTESLLVPKKFCTYVEPSGTRTMEETRGWLRTIVP